MATMCKSCGNRVAMWRSDLCRECMDAAGQRIDADAKVEALGHPLTSPLEDGVATGYCRGYEFVKTALLFGSGIWIAGGVLSALVIVGAIVAQPSAVMMGTAFVVALAIFGTACLHSVVVNGIAHVLRAALDSAVNASLFIEEQEKRRILGVSEPQREP